MRRIYVDTPQFNNVGELIAAIAKEGEQFDFNL